MQGFAHPPALPGYPRLHAPTPLPRCRVTEERMPLLHRLQYLFARAGRWWR